MKKEFILILGSNSDIAKSCADKFAKEGYNLILASRNVDVSDETAQDLRARYEVDVHVYKFEADKFATHKCFVKNLKVEPYGVILAFGQMHIQADLEDIVPKCLNLINVNFTGAVSILELLAKKFEERKFGFIIGISSVAGLRGRQSNYIYGSSKSGLITYLEGLQQRLHSSNVHVLIVLPGYVRTKMIKNLNTNRYLTASTELVSDKIYLSLQKKKYKIFVKPIWFFILIIIRSIPDKIFVRLNI